MQTKRLSVLQSMWRFASNLPGRFGGSTTICSGEAAVMLTTFGGQCSVLCVLPHKQGATCLCPALGCFAVCADVPYVRLHRTVSFHAAVTLNLCQGIGRVDRWRIVEKPAVLYRAAADHVLGRFSGSGGCKPGKLHPMKSLNPQIPSQQRVSSALRRPIS